MDENRIKELIIEALAEIAKEEVVVESVKAVDNKTKSVSEIIKEKSLSYKDTGSNLSGLLPMAVLKAEVAEGTRDHYRPSKDQLKKINKIAKEDQKVDSGYVFTTQATNPKNAVDRGNERFSDTALTQMAEKAVGNVIPFLEASKSDCEDHTWKSINVKGYVFNAYVKDGAVYYDTYVPQVNSNSDVIDRIFAGTLNKVSVGFSMSYSDVLCNSCKSKSIVDEDCPHQPGQMDEKGNITSMTIMAVKDNFEYSGVAVPCQAEAHISRSLSDVKEYSAKNFKNVDLTKVESITYLYNDYVVDSNLDLELPITLTQEFADSVKKIDEIINSIEIDKISNDEITIEDNNSMEPEIEKALDKPVVDETPVVLEEVITSVGLTEDKLCKVAENIKNQVVAELKAELKSLPVVDLSPVVEKLAELEAQLKKADETIKELATELAVSKGVPGSKTYVDAVHQGGPDALDTNPDSFIQ